MKVSKTLILSTALILAVVLVSGCLGTGTTKTSTRTAKAAADALDLKIDTEGRTTFDSGEEFIITLIAENTGEFDALDVKTRLQGYDGISKTGTTPVLSTLRLVSSKLERPDTEKNVPGDSQTIDWGVKAPILAANTPDRQITLTGEVFYTYTSLVTQTIVAVNSDYLKQLEDKRERVPVRASTEAKSGPVSISIEGPTPYVKTTGTTGTTNFRVKLILNNEGSGKAVQITGTSPNEVFNYDYLANISVLVPAGITVDTENCDLALPLNAQKADAEKEVTIIGSTNPDKLRLAEGGMARTLSCTFNIDNSAVGTYNTFTLVGNTTYTYSQAVTTDLTITQ